MCGPSSYTYNVYSFIPHYHVAGNKSMYPELSPPMIKKLRHLTIASLVLRDKNIPYELLLKELDLHNVRELEVCYISMSDHLFSDIVPSRTKTRATHA